VWKLCIVLCFKRHTVVILILAHAEVAVEFPVQREDGTPDGAVPVLYPARVDGRAVVGRVDDVRTAHWAI